MVTAALCTDTHTRSYLIEIIPDWTFISEEI